MASAGSIKPPRFARVFFFMTDIGEDQCGRGKQYAPLHAVYSPVAGQNPHKPLLGSLCELNVVTDHRLVSSNKAQVLLANGEPQPWKIHGDENQMIPATIRMDTMAGYAGIKIWKHGTSSPRFVLSQTAGFISTTICLPVPGNPNFPTFPGYLLRNCHYQPYEDTTERWRMGNSNGFCLEEKTVVPRTSPLPCQTNSLTASWPVDDLTIPTSEAEDLLPPTDEIYVSCFLPAPLQVWLTSSQPFTLYLLFLLVLRVPLMPPMQMIPAATKTLASSKTATTAGLILRCFPSPRW